MHHTTKHTLRPAVAALAGALALAAASAHSAEFRLPQFETVKLPSGLTLYLMERHEVPLISVRAVIKAGAVQDGAQAGLSSLTGDALLLGSRSHSKTDIDQAFDFRGARLAGGAGEGIAGILPEASKGNRYCGALRGNVARQFS